MLAAGVQRHAEVADLDVALFADEDVGRLDVAVNDSLPVGEFQRQAAFKRDFDDALDRQQIGDLAKVLQRRAVHILHDDVAVVLRHVGVVDRHDVRMNQLADQGGFVQENLTEAPAQVGVDARRLADKLDGDVPVRERILAEENAAGRPATDLLADGVLADLGRKGVAHG